MTMSEYEGQVICWGCHRLIHPFSNETICEMCAAAFRHGGVVWEIWKLVPLEPEAIPESEVKKTFVAIGNKLVEIIEAADKERGHEPPH